MVHISVTEKKKILKKNKSPGKTRWRYLEVVLHCVPNRCNEISFKQQAICSLRMKILQDVVKSQPIRTVISLGLRAFSHPQCTSQQKQLKLKTQPCLAL